MKRQLVRNLVLVGAGAALAIVLGAASAQDAAPQADEPAQLDRSFSDEDGTVDEGTGGAGAAGRADAGMMRRDGGTARAPADGGTGGAGGGGGAGTDEGEAAPEGEHTEIDVYGPMGR